MQKKLSESCETCVHFQKISMVDWNFSKVLRFYAFGGPLEGDTHFICSQIPKFLEKKIAKNRMKKYAAITMTLKIA